MYFQFEMLHYYFKEMLPRVVMGVISGDKVCLMKCKKAYYTRVWCRGSMLKLKVF